MATAKQKPQDKAQKPSSPAQKPGQKPTSRGK